MRKRNTSVEIKKVKKNKKRIKHNKTIKNIYKKFKSKIYRLVGTKRFVVAISGGPDSLSLAYLSKLYSKEFKINIVFLIIDHKIRKESTKEAKKVIKILQNEKIKGKILTWKEKAPNRNIQSNARKIRYSLIFNYCLKNKIKYVITAHHQDDQIENFLIRLFRGSGIVGLSSMTEKNELYNKKVKIIRPLLDVQKKELKQVAKNVFGTYIKDPSNNDPVFLRTRIRKYRKIFDKEGFDLKKILKTIDNLNSAKNALDFYKYQALKKHVKFFKKNKCLINNKLFKEEAKETIFRTLSDIFYTLTSNNYPPKSKKIMNLLFFLRKKSFKKATLAGYIIEKSGKFISITKA